MTFTFFHLFAGVFLASAGLTLTLIGLHFMVEGVRKCEWIFLPHPGLIERLLTFCGGVCFASFGVGLIGLLCFNIAST